MNKFLLNVAGAIVGLGMTSAIAADQQINLEATVPSFCSINNGTATATSVAGSPTAAVVDALKAVITVVNGAPTAVSQGASRDYTVLCNGNANFQLIATPVATSTPAPSGFSNKIGYTATASGAAAATATVTTASVTTPAAAANYATGTLNIAISAPTAANTLVAATDYTGTLTVRLDPQ